MYRLIFYVPETHLESVKDSVFAAGGGCYKDYDRCAWQIRGQGQFRPLAGSKPFIGEIDRTQHIDEYKVEMLVDDKRIRDVARALLDAHPYQQPAYGFMRLMNIDDL